MNEPAVVELKLAARNRAGTYRATMLMMPLRSDFGDINRVIGCTSGEGDLFAPPLAFRIEDVAVTPVEPSQGAEPRQAVPGLRRGAGRLRPAAGAEAARDRGQPERPGQAARRHRDAEAPGHRQQIAAAPPLLAKRGADDVSDC